MWVLAENERAVDTVHRLLFNRELIVGRKTEIRLDCDDKSISRQHASIFVKCSVGDNDKNRGCVTLRDTSKYGTFVNDKKLEKGSEVNLSEGNVIRFGLQWNSWTLHWRPAIIVGSLLTSEHRKLLSLTAADLGAEVAPDFPTAQRNDVLCLVMSNFRLSIKATQALACAIPIVLPSFLTQLRDNLAECSAAKNPELNDHLPSAPPNEHILDGGKHVLIPDIRRRQLFNGLRFVFINRVQFKSLHATVTQAGGQASVLDLNGADGCGLASQELYQSNVAVVSISGGSVNSSNSERIAALKEHLRKHNRRLIQEQELGEALLRVSTLRECNPSFNYACILAGVAQSQPANVAGVTDTATVLARDTQSMVSPSVSSLSTPACKTQLVIPATPESTDKNDIQTNSRIKRTNICSRNVKNRSDHQSEEESIIENDCRTTENANNRNKRQLDDVSSCFAVPAKIKRFSCQAESRRPANNAASLSQIDKSASSQRGVSEPTISSDSGASQTNTFQDSPASVRDAVPKLPSRLSSGSSISAASAAESIHDKVALWSKMSSMKGAYNPRVINQALFGTPASSTPLSSIFSESKSPTAEVCSVKKDTSKDLPVFPRISQTETSDHAVVGGVDYGAKRSFDAGESRVGTPSTAESLADKRSGTSTVPSTCIDANVAALVTDPSKGWLTRSVVKSESSPSKDAVGKKYSDYVSDDDGYDEDDDDEVFNFLYAGATGRRKGLGLSRGDKMRRSPTKHNDSVQGFLPASVVNLLHNTSIDKSRDRMRENGNISYTKKSLPERRDISISRDCNELEGNVSKSPANYKLFRRKVRSELPLCQRMIGGNELFVDDGISVGRGNSGLSVSTVFRCQQRQQQEEQEEMLEETSRRQRDKDIWNTINKHSRSTKIRQR